MKIRIAGTDTVITDTELTSTSLVDYATDGSEFRIGVAPSAGLNFTAKSGTGKFSALLKGKMITAETDGGETLGTFRISEVSKTRSTVSVVSYDVMADTDVQWRGRTFPCSAFEVITDVCDQCGIQLETTAAELPCYGITVGSAEGLQGKTCRELIKAFAEINGSIAVINRNGRLVFFYPSFSSYAAKVSYGDCKSFEIEESETKRAGCLLSNGTAQFQRGDTSCSFIIKENVFLSHASDSVCAEVAAAVAERVKETQFVAGKFELRSMPAVRAGDVIQITEENGKTHACFVSQLEEKDGCQGTIYAYGDAKSASESTSTSAGSTGSSVSSSTEIFIGKGQNNVPIDVRAGEYTICEKEVKDVSRFTRVFLNFSVQFVLPIGKTCVFSVYADDIKLKEIRFMSASDRENTVSYGLTADTTSAQSTVYSLHAEVPSGSELIIDPFAAEISLIVKSGTITDTQATDQYFPEKWKRPSVSVLAWQKMKIGEVAEGEIKTEIPDVCVDVSAAQDGSILATATKEEKVLHIRGTGRMIDDLRNNIYKLCPGDAGRNLIMSCTSAVFHTGITYIGSSFLTYSSGNSFTEVRIEIENEYEIGKDALGCWNDKNTKFKTIILHPEKIVKIADGGFKNANIYAEGFRLTGLTEITDGAFENNPHITGLLDIRNTEAVHGGCFRKCTGIESIFFSRTFKVSHSDYWYNPFAKCIGVRHLYCDRRQDGGPEYGTGWNVPGAEQHDYHEKTKNSGEDSDFEFGILDKVVLGSGGYVYGEDGGLAYVENGEIKETSDYKGKGTQFYAAYSPSIDATQSTPSS